jgi:hypothetical protein
MKLLIMPVFQVLVRVSFLDNGNLGILKNNMHDPLHITVTYITPGVLTRSWPEGHTCPTSKESFQVRWDNSIPLFLRAPIYLEVYLFC